LALLQKDELPFNQIGVMHWQYILVNRYFSKVAISVLKRQGFDFESRRPYYPQLVKSSLLNLFITGFFKRIRFVEPDY